MFVQITRHVHILGLFWCKLTIATNLRSAQPNLRIIVSFNVKANCDYHIKHKLLDRSVHWRVQKILMVGGFISNK